MPAARTLTTVAKELQSAANRLELANRHHNQDHILAALYADRKKGRQASGRLVARGAVIEALEADVQRLRAELSAMLDLLRT